MLTLFQFLRPYARSLPLVIAFGLAAYLSEGIGIGFLVPLFDVLLHGHGQGGPTSLTSWRVLPGGVGDDERLLLISSAIVALFGVKLALVWGTLSLSGSIVRRANSDLRAALYRRLVDADYALIVASERGRLLSLFDTQATRTVEGIASLLDLVIAGCATLIFVFLLCLTSWELTLVVATLALAARAALGRPLLRHLRRLGESETAAVAATTQHVLRSLSGMRVIRAFGQQRHEAAKFDGRVRDAGRLAFRLWRVQRLLPSILELAYAPAFLAAVVMAWYLGFDAPVLVAFLVLMLRLQAYLRAIDGQRSSLAGWAAAFRTVAEFLDAGNEPRIRSGTLPFESLRQGIEFNKLGFRFPSRVHGEPALSDVSVKIPARSMIAIIGESGAGKSTLINLLYRFYDPTEGEILIDGQPLPALDLDGWRARLAIAGQDAALLDGTIRDNIAYGRPDANEASVIDAARLAAIHPFIETLPLGYATEVGEGGVQLSEGQRQRLCLARAFLRAPDILILDEATNALDGLTEQVVQDSIERVRGRMTIIVIAHRLSTIRLADQLVVISGGQVVEQGNPAALLAHNSIFASLYEAEARRTPLAAEAD